MIEKEITLDNFLGLTSIAEDHVSIWRDKFSLSTSSHPVKDLVFYYEGEDFFGYKVHPDFQIFLSKNEPQKIEGEAFLDSNLRITFHSFKKEGVRENGIIVEITGERDNISCHIFPNEWEIYEFPICSQKVKSIHFTYDGERIDFSEKYADIMLNQIYYKSK